MLFHRRLDSKYASELQRSMGKMKLRPGKKKFRIESKKLFLYVQNKLGLSVYCYNKVAV